MNLPAFDTQKAVKEFKEGGFNDKQAEAVVTTMNDVMSQNFATKADLFVLKGDLNKAKVDLEQTIEKVRSDLEKSIEKVRSDLEKSIEKVRSDLENSIEKVRSDLEKSIEKVRSDLEKTIADKFETLYRHLWVMGIGIVLANVTLVAAAVALLGHKIG